MPARMCLCLGCARPRRELHRSLFFRGPMRTADTPRVSDNRAVRHLPRGRKSIHGSLELRHRSLVVMGKRQLIPRPVVTSIGGPSRRETPRLPLSSQKCPAQRPRNCRKGRRSRGPSMRARKPWREQQRPPTPVWHMRQWHGRFRGREQRITHRPHWHPAGPLGFCLIHGFRRRC